MLVDIKRKMDAGVRAKFYSDMRIFIIAMKAAIIHKNRSSDMNQVC